jgi:hypothetical protein
VFQVQTLYEYYDECDWKAIINYDVERGGTTWHSLRELKSSEKLVRSHHSGLLFILGLFKDDFSIAFCIWSRIFFWISREMSKVSALMTYFLTLWLATGAFPNKYDM